MKVQVSSILFFVVAAVLIPGASSLQEAGETGNFPGPVVPGPSRPIDRFLLLTSDGRIFASVTGADFLELQPGMSGSGRTFVDMTAGHNGWPYAMTNEGEVFLSSDAGQNWSQNVPRWSSGPADFTSVDAEPSGILHAVRLELHSYRYAPGDTQWTEGGLVGDPNQTGGGARGVAWISGTGSGADICGVLADPTRNLRFSSDGGNSWGFPPPAIGGASNNSRVDVLGNLSAVVLKPNGEVRVSSNLSGSNLSWGSLATLPASTGVWSDIFAAGNELFAVDSNGRVANYDKGAWAFLGAALPGVSNVVSIVLASVDDSAAPSSNVSPGNGGWVGWHNVNVTLLLNATDDQSVESISLYARRSLDGAQWSAWRFYAEYKAAGRVSSSLVDFAPYGVLGGQGYWQFATRANDTAKNVEPKDPQNLTSEAQAGYDTIAPDSGVSSLPPFSPPSFTVSWRSTDLLSKVATVVVFSKEDDGAWQTWRTSKGNDSDVFNGSAGHRYAFYSVAWDLAGNVEDAPVLPDAVTVVDDTAPATMFESLPAQPNGKSGWFTTVPMIWLNSSDVGGATYFRWDGAGQPTDYVGPFAALEGIHKIEYWSRDIAGNVENPKSMDLKIDSLAPVATAAGIPTFTNIRSLTIPVNASDGGGSGLTIVSLQYRTQGTTSWKIASSTTGSGQLRLDLASDGTYEVRAVAEDAAGNVEPGDSPEATIVVDSTPPSVVRSSPADGARDLHLRPTFVVEFSEAMDPATLAGAFRIPGAEATLDVTLVGDRNVTVKVVTTLPDGAALSLIVGTSARDLTGNPLAQEHLIRFGTAGGGLLGGGLAALLILVAVALLGLGMAVMLLLKRLRTRPGERKESSEPSAVEANAEERESEEHSSGSEGPSAALAGSGGSDKTERRARPMMRLEPGYNYLILSPQPRDAFEAFADLLAETGSGMLVTTTRPEKVLREFRIPGERLEKLWLTDSKGAGAVNPKQIEFELTRDTMAWLKKNPKGVLVLEGVEYLIAEGSFEKASRFVKKLADQASGTGATIIVTVDPGDVKDQLGVLRKGFDKVMFEGGTDR